MIISTCVFLGFCFQLTEEIIISYKYNKNKRKKRVRSKIEKQIEGTLKREKEIHGRSNLVYEINKGSINLSSDWLLIGRVTFIGRLTYYTQPTSPLSLFFFCIGKQIFNDRILTRSRLRGTHSYHYTNFLAIQFIFIFPCSLRALFIRRLKYFYYLLSTLEDYLNVAYFAATNHKTNWCEA